MSINRLGGNDERGARSLRARRRAIGGGDARSYGTLAHRGLALPIWVRMNGVSIARVVGHTFATQKSCFFRVWFARLRANDHAFIDPATIRTDSGQSAAAGNAVAILALAPRSFVRAVGRYHERAAVDLKRERRAPRIQLLSRVDVACGDELVH